MIEEDLIGLEECLSKAFSLHKSGNDDHAEALLLELIKRFPSVHQPIVDIARIYVRRRDFSRALAHAVQIVAGFPELAVGWSLYLLALREVGRLGEANAIGWLALQRFPKDIAIAIEFAKIPQEKADWEEACRRWENLRHIFPDEAVGYTEGSWPLRCLKKFDQADNLLVQAMHRFPDNAQAAVDYCRVAEDRGDWLDARERWDAFHEKFPLNRFGYAGLGLALERVGEIERSESVLLNGLLVYPNDAEFLCQLARIASSRSDWPLAIKRWEAAFESNPRSEAAIHGLGEARLLAQLDAEMGVAREGAVSGSVQMGSLKSSGTLMLQFESLGGNCEFGLVQRHFGVEPLGLLRWTGTPPELLALALHSRFEGVGDPENTVLEAIRGEWVSRDKNWRLVMHTFVKETEERYDTLFPKICRRLSYLKRKFLDDINNGDKVFIYQDPSGLSDEQISALYDGVRALGPATLLCVKIATEQYMSGSVTRARDGLLIGYIDRLGALEREGRPPSWEHISYNAWLSICEKALEIARNPAGVTSISTGSTSPELLNKPKNGSNEEVVSAFEGLGDNCEFGLVQRHFGAEPLGLLRWASISADKLAALLNEDIQGVGDPAYTELYVKGDFGEIFCKDNRYGIDMHTFVRAGQVDEKQFLKQQCRRMSFLADKLRQDLRNSEKIFLYKPQHGIISESETESIFQGLQRYAKNKFLCVTLANANHEDSSVRLVREDYALGYLQSVSADARVNDILFGSWLALLTNAFNLLSWPEIEAKP